jgi:hypothetical protein
MTASRHATPASLPLTLAWVPAPRPGPTLFVVFAYHGGDRDRLPFSAADNHRIVHRDHYANPRPFPYLLAMIETAAPLLTPDARPDVVFDERWPEEMMGEFAARFGRVERAPVADRGRWTGGLLAAAPRYANVVLVYADALGLGCEGAERVARRTAPAVLIVNGRRRAFRLDGAVAARLSVSRWLARTRIVERLLAVAVVPLATGLAGIDRLRGVRD